MRFSMQLAVNLESHATWCSRNFHLSKSSRWVFQSSRLKQVSCVYYFREASPISKQDKLPHENEKFGHVSHGAKHELTRNCQISQHYHINIADTWEIYEKYSQHYHSLKYMRKKIICKCHSRNMYNNRSLFNLWHIIYLFTKYKQSQRSSSLLLPNV
jgi:hypothetical protein